MQLFLYHLKKIFSHANCNLCNYLFDRNLPQINYNKLHNIWSYIKIIFHLKS